MIGTEVGGVYFIVDDEDGPILLGRKWRLTSPRPRYTYLSSGTRPVVLLHREITAAPKGLVVDHINGDTTDNRRSNLRVCTHQQNLWNRRRTRHTASKFKGVSRQTGGAKGWTARIGAREGRVHLGTFTTAEEAAMAYDRAAVAMYGEYACINFPSHFPNLVCRAAG